MVISYKTITNSILIALTIMWCFCFNANAQSIHHKTVKKTGRIKGILKDTVVVMNFKVCKSDNGYMICGETPGSNNSTFEEPVKPKKEPLYEPSKSDVIMLKGLPAVPKVPFPMTTPGPEIQSGAWFGINSWNGVW